MKREQNMRIMRLAAVVLAAVCGIATAGSKQPETFDVWLRAGVQIDETGHVQDLQWEEQSKVHALIAKRLAPVVRSWEFEPATADGQPAPTQTGLLIHLLAAELAEEIGRASGRERVCQSVYISAVAVSLKKQTKNITN